MKPGQTVKCQHCGKESFAVKKSVMDGWKKTGDILVCSSCSAKIADFDGDKAGHVENENNFSALEKLLSEKKKEGPRIEATDDEKHFCRDCTHFISHPFLSRCELHKKSVEPMDDCPQFRKK